MSMFIVLCHLYPSFLERSILYFPHRENFHHPGRRGGGRNVIKYLRKRGGMLLYGCSSSYTVLKSYHSWMLKEIYQANFLQI